jgi:hypothetical protein
MAVASAERLGDDLSLAYALRSLGIVITYRGESAAAAQHLTRARQHAEQLGDDHLIGTIMRALGEAYGLAGRTAEATESLADASQRFARLGEGVWET